MEIFSTYGQIKMVDFAMDKLHPNQGRGFAYVEFETADEAENAMKHMDGGKYKFFSLIVLLEMPIISFDEYFNDIHRTNRWSRNYCCPSIITKTTTATDAEDVTFNGKKGTSTMGWWWW